MDDAELDFLSALQDTVKECRKVGYAPNRFAGMIGRSNPFDVVRSLLVGKDVSDGFTELYLKKRLDLSVEAIALRPEWQSYFSQAELETARQRLAKAGHIVSAIDEAPPTPANAAAIASLLAELEASKGDRAAGKRIRSGLGALGHYGGLLQRENDIERGISRSVSGSSKLTGVTPPVHSQLKRAEATSIIIPPVPDAEALLARIRSLTGLPERNHEDVVKDLLLRLGFDACVIVFQQGRIDLCVFTQDRKVAAVFKVKRTISLSPERDGARRQGMDYAGQTGSPIIVVTDGDLYEIYDRRKGHNYEAMLCGQFQLTAFRDTDTKALDILRPDSLQNVLV